QTLGRREFLLGYVFATVRGHHAFALELAVHGRRLFGDYVFDELRREAHRRIRTQLARLPFSVAKDLLARVPRIRPPCSTKDRGRSRNARLLDVGISVLSCRRTSGACRSGRAGGFDGGTSPGSRVAKLR